MSENYGLSSMHTNPISDEYKQKIKRHVMSALEYCRVAQPFIKEKSHLEKIIQIYMDAIVIFHRIEFMPEAAMAHDQLDLLLQQRDKMESR